MLTRSRPASSAKRAWPSISPTWWTPASSPRPKRGSWLGLTTPFNSSLAYPNVPKEDTLRSYGHGEISPPNAAVLCLRECRRTDPRARIGDVQQSAEMAITSLIYTYAERIDAGDFAGIGEL